MKATTLSKCPVSGCAEQPSPIFCSTHWPKVSGDTRRELVRAFRELPAHPRRLTGLLVEGVREACR